MELTTRQQRILLGIYRDIADFASRTPRYDSHDNSVNRERSLIADAIDFGEVASDPSRWLGVPMSPSMYVAVSRVYQSLARKGLIIRHSLHGDVNHTSRLSLTSLGEATAKELAMQAAPRPKGVVADA